MLFFEKGAPTRNVWFYKLDPGRNLGKTNALNDADLEDFVKLQADFADSDNSWSVERPRNRPRDLGPVGEEPEQGGGRRHCASPLEIMDEILALDAESAEILAGMRGLLQ